MARIRSIKPEFFVHEDITRLSPLHRLLFIGLWTQSDREGRLEDRPRRLKVQVLPFDDCDLSQMLQDLDDAGFVQRYVHDGEAYLAIPSFPTHQRPRNDEPESLIPPPPERRSEPRPKVDDGQKVTTTVTTPSLIRDEPVTPQSLGKERDLEKGKGSTEHARTRFERFWSVYPSKVGKDAALKAFQRLHPSNELTDVMVAAVERQKASRRWVEGYIPNPATWLNQGRWKDEPERPVISPAARRPCRYSHTPPCADEATCFRKHREELFTPETVS